MGFMAKVKQWFGIGGVDVQLQCENQIAKQAGVVNGAITLSSKSDLHVLTLDVKMIEEFTTGRGDDEETKELELGTMRLAGAFDIKAGETKTVQFQLPFAELKSNADELKERGGALGALGAMAKFANAESSEFFVVADCDVKGTALDPGDRQPVTLY